MSALTQVQKTAKQALEKSLNVMGDEIKKALPKHMDAGRFARVVMTAVSRTPKLLECDQHSFFGSLLLAAQLGLEPNGVDQKCFMIPYEKKNGQPECQFQLGYRGLLELSRRSGEISSIHAEVAYEKDDLEIVLGMDPSIIHKPFLKGERGVPVLVYSVVQLKDGGKDFIWMPWTEVEKIKSGQTGRLKDWQLANSPWTTYPEEMAKKTCLKRHCKTLPLSAEIQNIVSSDESIKKDFNEDMTEPQEYTDVDVDVNEGIATAADKAEFYEWAEIQGIKHFLTAQERTEMQGTITVFKLDEMRNALIDRKPKEAKKDSKSEPVKESTSSNNRDI
jgi:recombination protein RecT